MNQQNTVESLSPWYHKVRLGDGTVTPGKIDTAEKFKIFSAALPPDLSGKSVIDLGCSSGGLALEYAAMGASVTGIESKALEVDQATFIFESYGYDGRFYRDDVMNAWRYGSFDIVNASGLLYHLPYPLMFLDLLSFVCVEQLILATRIAPDAGAKMDLMRPTGPGNWWFPTEECVVQMLKLAGFSEISVLSVNGDRSNLFCSARPPAHDISDIADPFQHLIDMRSPTGPRIIGSSDSNDLPT